MGAALESLFTAPGHPATRSSVSRKRRRAARARKQSVSFPCSAFFLEDSVRPLSGGVHAPRLMHSYTCS